MAATRLCSICGAEYEYCHTNAPHQYRWQDVACCKEHAAQYFAEIAKSRGQSLDTIPKEYTDLLPKKKVEQVVVADDPSEVVNDGKEVKSDSKKGAGFAASKGKSKKKTFGY